MTHFKLSVELRIPVTFENEEGEEEATEIPCPSTLLDCLQEWASEGLLEYLYLDSCLSEEEKEEIRGSASVETLS